MSSSWLVVLLSMERFIAVVFPLKAKFVCTRKNVYISISVIYGALITYNGVWTFASRIVNGKCVPHYPEPAQLSEIFIIIGTLVYSIIPVSFMLILTPIICFHLWKRIQNKNALGASSSKMSEEVKRTTVMLLGVSLAYMFLITPISIGHMISFSHDESIFETKHTGLAIYREISQILEQLNYSINFFLYVLCSKSFRDRVMVILRCFKPSPPKQRDSQTKHTKLSSNLSKNISIQGNDAQSAVGLDGIEAAVVETEKQQPDDHNDEKNAPQENPCVALELQSDNPKNDTSARTGVTSIPPKMFHWIGTYDVPKKTDVCSKENDTVLKSEETK
ncbi:hypothetical protein LOTGIDRAFT_164630 [Lottia gigantea]|uniref:G-protein coupled receptors family 1 profile domain-containing protein n=1 Tax=Lottia gigantea TaxID=225164 RepID=V3ZFK5_LOTGI|nr:hypothetical protein LOTGIDRAFT_164630 [Lottia gigantea]ESO89933.1 hypothetical protein LOTGIDRAFT_164630 [Lottia gigantea]